MTGAGSPLSRNWLVLRLCRAYVTEALRRYAAGRLLDVGCGTHPYIAEQTQCAQVCIGLEQDRERYAETPPRVWGSALQLPFHDRSFQTVFSSQVLEHVPEPGVMVSEMARVLCSGGVLIITAPHIWGLHETPHDYFRFTPHGLRHLASRAGLEPVETRAMGGYWVTTGARFCHYLAHFHRRGMGLLLRPLYASVQVIALGLDRLHRVESDAWNHLLVARKP